MRHAKSLRRGPGWLGAAVAICMAVALLLPVGAVAQDGMPALPHAFFGSLFLDGEPAPVGTVVTAMVGGERSGSVTVQHPGKYGSDEEGNYGPGIRKLIVQGNVTEDDVVGFYVGDAATDQTFPFASGESTELDLTIAGPVPSPTPASTPQPSSGPAPASPPSPPPTSPVSGESGGAATPTPTAAPAIPSANGADDAIPPATFQVVDLTVSPSEVDPGDDITVVVQVTDTGGDGGTCVLELGVDGIAEETRTIVLGPGATESVAFSVARSDAGSHTVALDGVSATFEVRESLLPAVFTLSNLYVRPGTVDTGETVDCRVTVTNAGEAPGAYTVAMKVNGAVAGSKEVTLGGGSSETVVFTLQEDSSGEYAVEIGDLSSRFVVSEQQSLSWSLIGGVIGGVLVFGLLLGFLVRRRTRIIEFG